MIRVSLSKDPEYAMKAGLWLVEFARGLMREQSAQEQASASAEVIEQLRGLYAKALPGGDGLVSESEESD